MWVTAQPAAQLWHVTDSSVFLMTTQRMLFDDNSENTIFYTIVDPMTQSEYRFEATVVGDHVQLDNRIIIDDRQLCELGVLLLVLGNADFDEESVVALLDGYGMPDKDCMKLAKMLRHLADALEA
jgi:hypothetical protein